MADDGGKSRLGRGLAALMGDVGGETPAHDRVRAGKRVPIEQIVPNPRNPRRTFPEAEIEELAASIRVSGLIQPIAVRPARASPDRYEIIAGERRWRASQRAGLHEVPVVLLDVSDAEALQYAIVENVQRTDLNAIEEAGGYLALADQFGMSQDDIARLVGKSRSHVANTMRLMKLSEPVRALVQSGELSAGHARILVGQPHAETLAREIVAKGLNVRQVEALARQDGAEQARKPASARAGKDADTAALEKRLSDALGLRVSVDHKRDASGVLHIRYRDLDQLEDVIHRLERGG